MSLFIFYFFCFLMIFISSFFRWFETFIFLLLSFFLLFYIVAFAYISIYPRSGDLVGVFKAFVDLGTLLFGLGLAQEHDWRS